MRRPRVATPLDPSTAQSHLPARPAQVLVVGGSGYFGRLVIEELLRDTDCRIVVGGRSFRRLRETCRRLGPSVSSRLTPRIVDLTRPASLEPALADTRVAICAAGPFQRLPLTLLLACLERRVHYVDLADDRGFITAAHEAVQKRMDDTGLPAVCCGWSAVPALSGLLARIAVEGMESVASLDVQIAPGNRFPRSRGTVASLLASVGRSFTVWRNGTWQTVTGWSAPRRFQFPEPVGTRTGYLVDVPDHALFPQLFGAQRVECRVGAELSWLNAAVSCLAWAAQRGLVRDWTPLALILQRLAALWGWSGHAWGAVGVDAVGARDGTWLRRRASIIAEREGQRIPVMPAVITTASLLRGDAGYRGLVPVDRWLTGEQLDAECARRGFRLVVEEAARA